MARRDLTNQKFGKLLAIKEVGKDKNGHIIWKCICDCGKEIQCLATNLTRGKTKSCGCLRKQNTIRQNIQRSNINIIGKKFGKLLVLEKIIDNQVAGRNKYKCVCDCGNITYVLPGDLISGRTQSCGCARSRGNQLILNILQNSNYKFDKEYKINYNNNNYFFDFVIYGDKEDTIKCFIEFDGQQHYTYQKNTKGWNNKKHFQKLQYSDKQKNNYCSENNIPLVRIPYWDFENITLEYLKEKIEKNDKI